MQGNKRVYPRERMGSKGVSYLLLFLSAVVLLSGLVWRGTPEEVLIAPIATATPIPTDEVFDETLTSREMTLPSGTWFALQLGAFENEAAANELAEQFARRGAAGYVWHDGRYRTMAAVYPSREDAQNVRRQLAEQHTVDSYLYQIDLPALRVRMQGMKGQLDILEAGFAHAHELVSSLNALSVSMDRQESDTAEVFASLDAVNERMQTIALRLQQRFQAPRHAAVQGLIDQFQSLAVFTAGLTHQESAVELATKLKWQTLSTLEALQAIYEGLT